MAFYQYVKTFNSDTFDYEELDRTDYVFMRWKEHFLVPDHTIKVELEIGFRKKTSFNKLFAAILQHTKITSYYIILSVKLSFSGYQRCQFCWFLLHLLPEVQFYSRGVLLP